VNQLEYQERLRWIS